VVASRTKPTADIEEDFMTDRKEREEERGERKGEYTDTQDEDVIEPEPEAGEYTDSDIPEDE
jgi:hypothetical protein